MKFNLQPPISKRQRTSKRQRANDRVKANDPPRLSLREGALKFWERDFSGVWCLELGVSSVYFNANSRTNTSPATNRNA